MNSVDELREVVDEREQQLAQQRLHFLICGADALRRKTADTQKWADRELRRQFGVSAPVTFDPSSLRVSYHCDRKHTSLDGSVEILGFVFAVELEHTQGMSRDWEHLYLVAEVPVEVTRRRWWGKTICETVVRRVVCKNEKDLLEFFERRSA